MVKTTRAQRKAIKRKWDQCQRNPSSREYWLTYKQFRKRAQAVIGCDNAVTVPWCGMWLCIETDGHTHT